MAVNVQISCINKSDRMNPYERILSVGGVRTDGKHWKMSQEAAIDAIEAGKYNFFVAVPPDDSVWVIVTVSARGNKYLKTQSDGDQPNNLLSLRECP